MPRTIATLWGNQDSINLPDEVLYSSEQVFIVNFKMILKNYPSFWVIEKAGMHLPFTDNTTGLGRIEFEYVHKCNGEYHYIGRIERMKVIKLCGGIACVELVILRPNLSQTYTHCREMSTPPGIRESNPDRGGAYYSCATKNDVARMRKWPKIPNEELIKKVIMLEDNRIW